MPSYHVKSPVWAWYRLVAPRVCIHHTHALIGLILHKGYGLAVQDRRPSTHHPVIDAPQP